MTADQLKIIKQSTHDVLPESDIILFGSRARHDSGKYSDFDLLVVTNKELTSQQKFPLKTDIRKRLLKYGIFSDILILSQAEIEQKKELPGHIIKTILQEGVRI